MTIKFYKDGEEVTEIKDVTNFGVNVEGQFAILNGKIQVDLSRFDSYEIEK